MTSGPISIRLVDLHNSEAVDALLHVGLTEQQIRNAQTEWEPIRKQSSRTRVSPCGVTKTLGMGLDKKDQSSRKSTVRVLRYRMRRQDAGSP